MKGRNVQYKVSTKTVQRTVTVGVSVERAFELFTEEMMAWWPESHHLGGVPQSMIIEPRAGGRVYDRYADGRESPWASVLAYEPPTHVRLAWHLDGAWTYDPDPAHASVVDVRFIAESATVTRVELSHSGFERHLEAGDAVREAVESPDGWQLGLDAFARAAYAH